jgi:predicted PurR-regulated permease PerM
MTAPPPPDPPPGEAPGDAPTPAPAPIPAAAPAAAPTPPRDLPRLLFSLLALGGLVAATVAVLWPFLGAGLWAAMIVVATWPLVTRLDSAFGGRRSATVTLLTVALLLLLVVPLAAAVATVAGSVDRIAGWLKAASEFRLPEVAPAALADLPVVGPAIAAAWEQFAALGLGELWGHVSPYAGDVTRWIAAQAGDVGTVLVQFLVTVAISAVLWAWGEEAAGLLRRFARRIAPTEADASIALAAGAVRGVALGVGGTAIVQALFGGLGVWIAGVPFAGLLTALMFMFSIVQAGPVPVLLPAAIWLIWSGETGWGIFLLVWAAIVGTLDNVVRPLLIRIGADLPFLLIFTGVLGGLLVFGLIGVFVGPLVLAIAWKLLLAWLDDPTAETPRHDPP